MGVPSMYTSKRRSYLVGCYKKIYIDRFSVSWSRVLPDGYPHKINEAGLQYYSDLVDELLANGIQPLVTMYHWDLPQKLHEIGGWTNPHITDYFEGYAKVLFDRLGDRVKYWITVNTFCDMYGADNVPPMLDHSGIAQYQCSHSVLLAHAKVYHLYERQYRSKQKGKFFPEAV